MKSHRSHKFVRKGQSRKHRSQKSRSGAFDFFTLKATIDKNRKGFAFLIFDEPDRKDVFVNPREASRLFQGDRVTVTLSRDLEIIDLKITEHRFRELVGKFTLMHNGGYVVYERKRSREEIFITGGSKGAKNGDWVHAKLHFHERGPHPVTAEVVTVIGAELSASTDISMIASEFNLVEVHSAQAEQEAKNLLKQDIKQAASGRQDLTNLPFITIDGETARDFDDAILVVRQKSGYFLWVAIADVSHYVTEGKYLDQEAKSRGTSVYFPERAFHMLPSSLSENLCSLKPNEPRLALVARMEMGWSGERIKTEVFEAVIQSKRRATYTEIQKEWELNQHKKNWEFSPHFELYKLIRKKRSKRGSMDFDLPEAEILVNPKGEPVSISKRTRLDTHRLIEEFMIEANEAVTEWTLERKWPFIYRIHEEPSLEAVENFQKLASGVGVAVSFSVDGLQLALSDLIRRLEGHPAQGLLNMALLRSMKKAIYSSAHSGHFGLASKAYTHFTSPIRRYPDLVVHRILKHIMRVQARKEQIPSKNARAQLEKDLKEIAEHCSYRERLATDAERESIRVKQVRALLPLLGDEFEAKVIGMVTTGLFVEIENPYAEGLISAESLADDIYEFNEERMVFVGKRKKRAFKIGDRLVVKLLRADLERRQVDFGLVASLNSARTTKTTKN